MCPGRDFQCLEGVVSAPDRSWPAINVSPPTVIKRLRYDSQARLVSFNFEMDASCAVLPRNDSRLGIVGGRDEGFSFQWQIDLRARIEVRCEDLFEGVG